MGVEVWDILDAEGNKTGKTAIRGKHDLKNNEYHLVVHIWVVSSDGKFLIQRRALSKKLMPGEWAATGGAAISGEDSLTAANRELYEELGLVSDNKKMKKLTRLKRRSSLLDIWAITTDINALNLVFQKSEVCEVKWVTKEELEEMIKSKKFHNYGKEYFDAVFMNIEKYRGVTV